MYQLLFLEHGLFHLLIGRSAMPFMCAAACAALPAGANPVMVGGQTGPKEDWKTLSKTKLIQI